MLEIQILDRLKKNILRSQCHKNAMDKFISEKFYVSLKFKQNFSLFKFEKARQYCDWKIDDDLTFMLLKF